MAYQEDSIRPLVSLDVTQVSTELRDVIAEPVRKLGVEFLGEDSLVIMSVDGMDTLAAAARQSRAPRALHLTLDFLKIKDEKLVKVDQLKFPTDSSDARLSALPSGSFLVSAGGLIHAFDSRRHLLAKKRIDQVCDLEKELRSDTAYTVFLLSASERMGVVNLWIQKDLRTDPANPFARPQFAQMTSEFCWFSSADLTPLRHLVSKESSPTVSAREDAAFVDHGGINIMVSPQGDKQIYPRPECPAKHGFVDLRRLYPVRAERALAYSCNERELAIEVDGKIDRIPVRKAWPLPFVAADAWYAPILLLDFGTAKVGGRGFELTSTLQLVNYKTKKTFLFPTLRSHIAPPIAVLGGTEYALSPSGRLMAVLHGAVLSVYKTPSELLVDSPTSDSGRR
jgi:hypothetical protein